MVAINGPALGLGASILPLCDVVWASERAWFQTPCAALHITPSGCSSYTFPQILGVALVGTVNIKTILLLVFIDLILIVVASTYLPPSRLRDKLEILLNASISVPYRQANEMLFCGRKLTAQEACSRGLVSQVFWPTTFNQEVMLRVKEMAACNAVVSPDLDGASP